MTAELGSVNATKPTHLIWEIDDEDKTTTVPLNGSSTTFDNLSVRSPALRNSVHYPGPIWIRLNHNDTGSQEARTQKSVKANGMARFSRVTQPTRGNGNRNPDTRHEAATSWNLAAAILLRWIKPDRFW